MKEGERVAEEKEFFNSYSLCISFLIIDFIA